MKKLIWIIIAIVIVVAVAFWFKGSSTAPSTSTTGTPVAETGPIKIGVVLPLTGDAASYGEPGKTILQIAIDKINASGGINGRQVSMVLEDGKCNGKDGANATQKLLNIDKVKVVTGYFCSSETLASVPLVKNGEGFILALAATSPDLTGISKYFARMYPSDAGQSKVIADEATKQGLKKIAILHESTDYALGVSNAFVKSFGGETVVEAFQSDATDLRTPLTKLQSSKADGLLIAVQTPASAEKVLTQLQKTGWKPKFFLDTVLATSPDVVKKYSALLEGAHSANFYVDPTNPELKALRETYASKNNGAAIPFEAYMAAAYDGMLLIKDAIESAGENPDKLSDYFRSVNGWNKGVSGAVSINPDGDRASGNLLVVVKNGGLEFVK